MLLKHTKVYYGWFVLAGSCMVVLGVSGGQFSFGVFMKPMTEEFGWSRATLSLAFGITFMLSGLLRPVAGYLADRYSPKAAVLTGVAVMGTMLLLIPLIGNLFQLYLMFAVMSIGITLGSGPILTKVVSSWFYQRRGVTLGLVGGASSLGAMILVPGASLFLVLFDWKEAYWFLGMLLLILVLPVMPAGSRLTLHPKGLALYFIHMLGIALALYLLMEGLRLGNVSVVIPLVHTFPLLVVLIAWIFLREKEQVTARLFLGSALIVAGAAVITGLGH